MEVDVKRNPLTPAVRVQVEIALTSIRGDPARLSALESDARELGLSGAEIDAAKRGASFNVVADAIVKYALGLETRDAEAASVSEGRLASFGMPMVAIEIALIVDDLH
jgi:hypothetical protein